MQKLEDFLPLGYSSAVEVIEVGKNVDKFHKGDSVACAGGGYATHSEYVVVPKNLTVKIPQDVSLDFDIVSNPEFLREGKAVYDFFYPDRIVIGAESEKAREIIKEIYRPLYLIQTPFIFTNIETAEMIKYAANSFLAMKITFINEVANLCEKVGADVHGVAKALGMNGRISPKFLRPGPGYGGSCFPKDTKAFVYIARQYGSPLSLIKATLGK